MNWNFPAEEAGTETENFMNKPETEKFKPAVDLVLLSFGQTRLCLSFLHFLVSAVVRL